MPRTGVTSERSQPPSWISRSLETIRRARASRSASVCSATLSWLVPGVIVTATRCCVAAARSMRS